MGNEVKPGYGNFVMAAAAYIVGVLLFAFWSYNAHRTALHDYVDKSLMNAAFAAEEIVAQELLKNIEQNSDHTDPAFAKTKEQLNRIAQQGNFCAVAAGVVHHDHITILISGSESSDKMDQSLNEHLPISHDLKTEILQRAAGGVHDAGLFTAVHPAHGAERHAMIFKAIDANSGYVYIVEQQNGHIKQQLAGQLLRTAIAAFGMLALAIPLIALFSRTQRNVAQNLSKMNEGLQNDVETQKNREAELKEAISDLERFNAVSAGRETRIIELKAEVNDLLEKMNQNKRYNIDKID